MSKLSRRKLLSSAAGVLAATSVGAVAFPALAAGPLHSPEFLRWYELAKTLGAVLIADTAWELAHPNASRDVCQAESPYNKYCDDLFELEDLIFARAVRSWTDVAEIGLIALYWSDKEEVNDSDPYEPRPFALGLDPELDFTKGDRAGPVLIQAVAKLALGLGGGNVI